MATFYEQAQEKAQELVYTLVSMGFPKEYSQRVVRHIDPTHPIALDLCCDWIERHPPRRRRRFKEVEDDETAIVTVVSMGFDREDAVTALRAMKNDVEAAVVWILNQQVEHATMQDELETALQMSAAEHASLQASSSSSTPEQKQQTNTKPKPKASADQNPGPQDNASIKHLQRQLEWMKLKSEDLAKSINLSELQGLDHEDSEDAPPDADVVPQDVLGILTGDSKSDDSSQVVFPAFLRPEQPVTGESLAEKRARLRRAVLSEIMTTEMDYVENLDTLLSEYISVMESSPASCGLAAHEVKLLGSNLSQLLQLNKQFLLDLQQRVYVVPPTGDPDKDRAARKKYGASFLKDQRKHMDQAQLGDLLLTYASFFKIYIVYVNNHSRAVEFMARATRQAAKKYKAFNAFLQSTMKQPKCKGRSLSSFLILPVQRIPRYSLLVDQLLKYTEPGTPDHSCLKASVEKMRATAGAINSAMKKQEEMMKVVQVQEQFTGDVVFVTPHGRRLISEGQVTVCDGRNMGTWKKQSYHLFNDLFVLSERSLTANGMRHSLQAMVPINAKVSVDDLKPGDDPVPPKHARSVSSPPTAASGQAPYKPAASSPALLGADSFMIRIIHNLSFFLLKCDDANQKKEMLANLRQCRDSQSSLRRLSAIEDSAGAAGRSFTFVKNESDATKVVAQARNMCPVCNSTIPLLQRRKCNHCRVTVHNKCSRARMIIPHSGDNHAKRVCDLCTTKISRSSEVDLGGTLALEL